MEAWLWAVGGMVVGGVIGALAIVTAILAKFTGKSWWEVWRP